MEETIMNYENEGMDTEVEVVEEGGSGIGTGVAMLIGAGLTLATTAIVKLGKKLWDKHKANKELRKPDEHDFVEPTQEEIEAVTSK